MAAKTNKMFPKKKRTKIVVSFNEESRKDFLLGFRRRKNERRRKAKEALEKKEKDNKKQLKAQKKKVLLEHVEKQRKELEALESDTDDEGNITADVDTTYEYPEHVVTVTTVCDIDFGSKSTCIGPNKLITESQEETTDINGTQQEASEAPGKHSNKQGTLLKRQKFKTKLNKHHSSTMKSSKRGKRKKDLHYSHGNFKRKKKSQMTKIHV